MSAIVCCNGIGEKDNVATVGGCSACEKMTHHELLEAHLLRARVYQCTRCSLHYLVCDVDGFTNCSCGSKNYPCQKNCGSFAVSSSMFRGSDCLLWCFVSLVSSLFFPPFRSKGSITSWKSFDGTFIASGMDELTTAMATAQLRIQAEEWHKKKMQKRCVFSEFFSLPVNMHFIGFFHMLTCPVVDTPS